MLRQAAILLCLCGLSGTLALASAAAGNTDYRVFTLYRSSVVTADARYHVATFDAGAMSDEEAIRYNQENCQIAASLFREQPGVKVLYWCEPGRAPDALGAQ